MKIKVTVDPTSVRRASEAIAKQVRFASLRTATTLVQNARAELQAEIRRVFDRPVGYVTNAVRIEPATRQQPHALVWLKGEYGGASRSILRPQVFGGRRPQMRFERMLEDADLLPSGWLAVPGRGARRTVAGNMSQGQLLQVLSVVKAFKTAGFDANITRRSRRRNLKPRDYFVVNPWKVGVAPNRGRLPWGIWEAYGPQLRQRRSVLFFIPSAHYRPRLAFFDVVRRVVRRDRDAVFRAALADALRTAR